MDTDYVKVVTFHKVKLSNLHKTGSIIRKSEKIWEHYQ